MEGGQQLPVSAEMVTSPGVTVRPGGVPRAPISGERHSSRSNSCSPTDFTLAGTQAEVDMDELTESSPQPRNLAAQMEIEGDIQKRSRPSSGSTPSDRKKRQTAPKSKAISKRPQQDNRNSAGHEPVYNSRDRDLGKKPTTHDGSTFRISKKPEYSRRAAIEIPMGSVPGPNADEVPSPAEALTLNERTTPAKSPPAKKPTPSQAARISAEKIAAEVRAEKASPSENRKRLDYLKRRLEAQQHEMALLTAQLEPQQPNLTDDEGNEKENQVQSPPKAQTKAPRPQVPQPPAQPMQVRPNKRRRAPLSSTAVLALLLISQLVPCAQAIKFSITNASDRGLRTSLDNIRAAVSARLPVAELKDLRMVFSEGQKGPFLGHINASAAKILIENKKIFPLDIPPKGDKRAGTAIPFTVLVPHTDTARSDNKGAYENVQSLGWMLLSVPTSALLPGRLWKEGMQIALKKLGLRGITVKQRTTQTFKQALPSMHVTFTKLAHDIKEIDWTRFKNMSMEVRSSAGDPTIQLTAKLVKISEWVLEKAELSFCLHPHWQNCLCTRTNPTHQARRQPRPQNSWRDAQQQSLEDARAAAAAAIMGEQRRKSHSPTNTDTHFTQGAPRPLPWNSTLGYPITNRNLP